MPAASNLVLAECLFDAIARGDVAALRECLADDAIVWSNVAGPRDVEKVAAGVRILAETVPDFRYEEAVRVATPAGFVEEHMVRGTSPAGSTFSFPVCCLATVRDGRITRLHEYFDGEDAAAVGLGAAAETSRV